MTCTVISGPVVDLVYPVGSIYMSASATSPATLFGGAWERITGKFLLAATDNGSSGASQAAGNTGGAATVKLTAAQSGVAAHAHGMNHKHKHKHTHTYAKATGASSHTLTLDEIPSHNHKLTFNKSASAFGSGYIAGATQAGATADAASVIKSAGGGGGHTHGVTTASTASGAASADYTGNALTTGSSADDGDTSRANTNDATAAAASEAHNNMPPYLAVYIWKRTA